MPVTPEMIQELEALSRYDAANHQQGIKIHKNADATLIAAARRLHEKGLTSQVDGGYLTSLGLEVIEHLQAVVTILDSGKAAADCSAQQGA